MAMLCIRSRDVKSNFMIKSMMFITIFISKHFYFIFNAVNSSMHKLFFWYLHQPLYFIIMHTTLIFPQFHIKCYFNF